MREMTKEVLFERKKQQKCKQSTGRELRILKRKSDAVRAKKIEPLNPDIVQEINQEELEYGSDHRANLFISAAHYVVMASVSRTYKKMKPFHVVLDTG